MPRGDAAPERLVASALRLFARHGVAGTSLQMIADDLGVTKAAVYYHFRTKDAVVHAVLAPAFAGFAELLDEVERHPQPQRAALLVDGLARQAVQHRALYSVVLRDVAAAQLGRRSAAHTGLWDRLRATLAGPQADGGTLVGAAMFLSGLVGPAVDPDVLALDDDVLERAIRSAGRRLLGLDGVDATDAPRR
ncbi:TetR/AcrR family transcriptional regulator [Cellulomonas persica]|uniref:TetR family transcriptional regulator n=1 Tax=Cellulomonas persica TaxID=76861 RepID=A0A510UQX4_9CELL|nr:TetR/AcrR family transcriptional regulator [Cellulomonas persica]GEK17067.1 TetR family transcriptional regulator [Cellulomonas persica]